MRYNVKVLGGKMMKKLTKNKPLFIITLILLLTAIGGSGFLFYEVSLLNNIEDTLRLIGRICLIIIDALFILFAFKFLRKGKKIKNIILIIIMLLYSGVCIFAACNINKVYSSLTKVSDSSDYTTYSSSLVTLATNDVDSIDDIGDETLGILSDETSYESNIIPTEVISSKKLTNKTQEYESAISMIDDLIDGKIKYIFLPTNYSIMYGSTEGYEDLKTKTKIIYTKTKKVKKDKDESSKSKKKVTEPFTILLMGVDSETEGIEGSSFNGDSLMLITFNPKTLSATMLSIPRDSYVPISCFTNQRKNKITHAAWQGENCMINTIENFLSVDIDYYVKINFKGVVKLVDTLGGVKVDVPYSLCEQDSNRQWGSNTVYIKKGLQTLNGEQALAYSRNRHPNPTMCSSEWTNYTSNDFIRGQHQQEVVTALLNKLKNVKNLDTMYKLLDTVSNNMVTNMSTNQILSLYNVVKDMASKSSSKNVEDMLQIQRLYLNGYDQRIVDYGGTGLELYNYVLYDSSIKAVSDAMKVNLGEKKEKTVKTFSFNINNPYEEVIIGKDEATGGDLTLLPSFVGQSLSYAQSLCSSYGIKVNVKYVTSGGTNGTVVSQSVSAKANVEDVSSITLTVVQKNDTVTSNTNKSTSSTKAKKSESNSSSIVNDSSAKEEEPEETDNADNTPSTNDNNS
jgi:LCP family protein required for cell wall assembly